MDYDDFINRYITLDLLRIKLQADAASEVHLASAYEGKGLPTTIPRSVFKLCSTTKDILNCGLFKKDKNGFAHIHLCIINVLQKQDKTLEDSDQTSQIRTPKGKKEAKAQKEVRAQK